MKKFIIAGTALVALAVPAVASADKPVFDTGGGSEIAVHNSNANPNAVWGQDRSHYASTKFFGQNMDIKQSFLPENGKVSDQKADWVETYGPDAE